MSELGPIPDAEQSPPWHQWFVNLKKWVDEFVASTEERFAAIDEQIDGIINPEDISGDKNKFIPVGSMVSLSFAFSGETINAGEKKTFNGSQLRYPPFFSDVALSIAWRPGQIVGFGTWQLIGGPEVTLAVQATVSGSNMFKRIT